MTLPTDVANELDAITGEADPKFEPTGEGFHAKLHNDANDEINSIAAELGSNPSGAQADVAARLAAMDLVLASAGSSISAAAGAITAEVSRAEAAEATKAALVHASRHQLGGADSLALPQYDPYDLLPYVIPMSIWPGTTLVPTAKRATFLRFTVARKRVFRFLRFSLTTVGSGEDKIDCGIYTVSGAKLERLGSSGAQKVTTNALGVKAVEMTGNVTCEPGIAYWTSSSWETVTGTPQVAAVLNNGGFYGDIGGTGTLANRIQLFKAETFVLPASVEGFTSASSTPVPWVVPSES